MKRILALGITFILLSFTYDLGEARKIIDHCDRDAAKEKCKKALVPYRYSSMQITNITFRGYNQIKEVTIPLFYDSKYRFVFNTEGLPHDIMIEIYDKHSTERKKRDKPLATYNSNQKQFNYEPDPELGLYNIYVNYLIPAVASEDNNIDKGCVMLMSGFENELSFDTGGDETN